MPTKQTPQTPTALAAYLDAQRTAHALLTQVDAMLEHHQDTKTPEEIHWGHVGDINAIVHQLQQMMSNA